MFITFRNLAVILTGGVLVSACASLSAKPAFNEVAEDVAARTGQTIKWDEGGEGDLAARGAIEGLLARPLTMDSATQIALLNNRGLQSSYMALGIAQAELVQAGLLKNPVFDASVIDPVPDGLPVNLAFGVVFQFIDALQIPLRRRIAASKLEEAKIRVTMQVLDHAALVQMAFIDYLASKQMVELLEGIKRAAQASLDAAMALRQAGNTTALDLEREKSQLTRVRLEIAQAKLAMFEAREMVNVALGLDQGQLSWRSIARLPDMPKDGVDLGAVELRALEYSLDLSAVEQRLVTLAHKYGIERVSSILPDLELGFEIEREEIDKEWRRGPTVGLVVPLFDQGRAKLKSTEMEIRSVQNAYLDKATKIRSSARNIKRRLKKTRAVVQLTNRQLVPQMTKILTETQRHYNAMQSGVFTLLRAKRGQIDAGGMYIRALRDYWRARIQFGQIMSGNLPTAGERSMVTASASAGPEDGGH